MGSAIEWQRCQTSLRGISGADKVSPLVCGSLAIAIAAATLSALSYRSLDEAVETYLKAIELDPQEASVHSNLGIALNRMGEVAVTAQSLHKGIELLGDPAAGGLRR